MLKIRIQLCKYYKCIQATHTQKFMLFYIIIFILVNILGLATSDTYITGNAHDLISLIDETMHKVQFSILSFENAELALKDTLHMYTWDPKPSLSNIHKSFFNLKRYSGSEIVTVNKQGYYGTFDFSEKEEIVTHQEMIFMTLVSGSNITLSKNSTIILEQATKHNIKIAPSPNNTYSNTFTNPNSPMTLEVIEGSAGICIQNQNTKITFNSNTVIHYAGKLLSKGNEAKIEAGGMIYCPSNTRITLQPDILFTIVNSNSSYINEYNMTRRSLTSSGTDINVERNSIVIFHNKTKLNTTNDARFILKNINSKCHVEREYIAQVILNRYAETLSIKNDSDDTIWCNSVKSNNYLAKNEISRSRCSQILQDKCQLVTSDASIISLGISSYILILLMII